MTTRGRRPPRRPVAYLFFDLLWLDGRPLDDLGVAGPAWQPVASFPGQGTALLAATRAQGSRGSSPSASTAPTCQAGAAGCG